MSPRPMKLDILLFFFTFKNNEIFGVTFQMLYFKFNFLHNRSIYVTTINLERVIKLLKCTSVINCLKLCLLQTLLSIKLRAFIRYELSKRRLHFYLFLSLSLSQISWLCLNINWQDNVELYSNFILEFQTFTTHAVVDLIVLG